MAGRNYLAGKQRTPLITVEDVVDNSNPFSTTYKFGDSNDCYEQQNNELQGILQRQKEVQQETVESIKRSRALLLESEVVGVKTAEELLHQGEQLKRIENRLDDTNANLQETEKNIRGFKGIFGEFKNYLSEKFKRSQSPEPKNLDEKSTSSETSSSPLLGTINSSKMKIGSPNTHHPGFRGRGFDHHSPEREVAQNADNTVDEGLEDISACLDRLKELSIGLGNEIDNQNELIPRLTDNTSKADETIQTQNKELSDILRK